MLCPICEKEMKTSDDIHFECSCGVTISEYREVESYDEKGNKRIRIYPIQRKYNFPASSAGRSRYEEAHQLFAP
jgi:hypothetical protein